MAFSRLETFVHEKVETGNLPGVSAAFIRNGETVWAKGFGWRSIEDNLSATPDTLYRIASVTKSFTSLAIMQLAEQGKLSVNDPVSKHLPTFALEPGGEPVRIWHFMSHASGIPALGFSEQQINAHIAGQPILPMRTTAGMIDFLNGAANWVTDRPGQRYYYLNEGYALLGAIIETVSGLPYPDYIAAHILQPLGMARSTFSRDALTADPDAAIPYVTRTGQAPETSSYVFAGHEAKGGLISSVNEMARYITMYLNNGSTGTTQLISPESIRAMKMPRITIPQQGSLFGSAGYGYGLRIVPDFFGRELIEHAGSVGTATSDMAFIPAENIGVIILANGSGYPTPQIAQYALALALGEDPDALPFVRQEQLMTRLTGSYTTYHDTMKAVIQQEGDCLRFSEPDAYHGQTKLLIPDSLGGDRCRFYMLAAGIRTPVEFRLNGDQTDMIFERYLFRKTAGR
jgi:CubicO group peptidase (beta-lactamase class C family)